MIQFFFNHGMLKRYVIKWRESDKINKDKLIVLLLWSFEW